MGRPKQNIKNCRECNILLTKNNRFSCDIKGRRFVCKKCHRIYDRNYKRKFYIGYSHNGKTVSLRGIKRPFPKDGKCEICKKNKKEKYAYHHWDDKNISKGLWVCHKCHWISEGIDELKNKLGIKYLQLKNKINKIYEKN